MAYGDFKDLAKRTAADKVLRDKAFNIAKDPKYDRYQRGLAAMVYKFLDRKTADSSVTTLANKSVIKSTPQNEQRLQIVVSLRLQINLLLNLHLKMNN